MLDARGLQAGAGAALFSVLYTAMGVLQGQRRVVPLLVAAVCGGWLTCVPLSYVFTRVEDWGLRGLWYALFAGYVVATAIAGTAAIRGGWHIQPPR